MSSTSKSKSKSKSKSPPERESNHQDLLSPHQQHALDQLRELTNGADEEVSMAVLKSVEWDVQVRFFRYVNFMGGFFSLFLQCRVSFVRSSKLTTFFPHTARS